MQRALFASVVLLLAVLLVPGAARAHITLTSPPARYGTTEQKDPPCGRVGGTRTDRVTVYEPGETITIAWNETIGHSGHFRIAFDADGDDDLDVPMLSGGEWVTPAGVTLLAEHMPDPAGGGAHEATITLPNVECESCTLQLIQVMYGRVDPYYFQCSDLALRCATPGCTGSGEDAGPETDAGSSPATDAGAPVDAGGATGSGAGGCAVCSGIGGGGRAPIATALALAGLAIVVARRRQRR